MQATEEKPKGGRKQRFKNKKKQYNKKRLIFNK